MRGTVQGKLRTHSFVDVGGRGAGLNGIVHFRVAVLLVLRIGVLGIGAVGHFDGIIEFQWKYGYSIGVWNMV